MDPDLERDARIGGHGVTARRPARWYARELEVRYGARRLPVGPEHRRIRGPEDIARACADLADQPVEVFRVLLLDGRHRLSGWVDVSVGTINASLVHPREVFAVAVERRVHAVVLVHNHPTGETDPSPEDRAITHRLRAAGEILGIEVLDHIIVGSGGYASARVGGWLDGDR